MDRSVIKCIQETIPFLPAPIVGSKKDFPVFKNPFKKVKTKLTKDDKT